METNTGKDGNPEKSSEGNNNGGPNENNNNNNNLTMSRAQSNLDILSQTAAVIEAEASLNSSNSNNCRSSTSSAITVVVESSPPQPARVTPAEYQNGYRRLQKTIEYSTFDDPSRKSFLALPEISSKTKQTEYIHHRPQPATFLEQKRGFLPPAVSFESGGGGGILVGGQPLSMDGATSFYPHGLYVTHSEMSDFSTMSSVEIGTKHVNQVRVKSPPAPPVHTTIATVSTGSKSGTNGSGSTPTCGGGDGETGVNSFLSNPSNSFSSAGGASVTSSVIAGLPSPHPYQFNNGTNLANATPYAAFVPPLQHHQRNDNNNNSTNGTQVKNSIEFSDEILRENFLLRQQVATSNMTIATLQNQVATLQNEIRQLQAVPSGKISQIPIDEMLTIMRDYGSEVSDTAMPPRKSHVQKASVVRQFRRWNPNFTDWFVHVNGKWIPKLGKEAELKRRSEVRLMYMEQRAKKQKLNATKAKTSNADVDDVDQGDDAISNNSEEEGGSPTELSSVVQGTSVHSNTSSNDAAACSIVNDAINNLTAV